MTLDLKPCPFCGAESFRLYSDGHAIQCGRCDAGGPQLHETEKDQTAEHAWNTRHVPEPSEADVERVARAIYGAASATRDEQKGWIDDQTEWNELQAHTHAFYCRYARAAIAAYARGTT